MKKTTRLLKTIFTSALLFSVIFTNAQTNSLRVNPNIVVLQDSVESKIFVNALNAFLTSAQKPNEENKYILEAQKLETFLLLDEVSGIEKSGKFKDDFFYKPYLTNLSPLADRSFLVQVSYIGTNEGVALTRASFEFIAHKANGAFLFSSPLIRNTKYWKVEKINNNIFHYQQSLDREQLKKFNKLTTAFDSKLKAATKTTEYYCTDDINELQRLIGVQYKSDYNGRAESVCSSSFGDRKLLVLGNSNATFDNFDPHDLFHDRLSLVISRSSVNKPVDEGCAYLYGGSWGLTWQEIFTSFKEQIANNKSTRWDELKEKPVYFQTKGFNNSADYIVNALIVKKIEKEKGFEGVWKLLNVGPVEAGNEKYYQTLETLTGIKKANYNERVWQLINDEK